MYIMLQNSQSVTSAIKVVRDLLNVEDVLSLISSALVKYKSMLRSITCDFDKFATYLKTSFTLPSKPNRRNANEPCNPNNMSNITYSIPAPLALSRTPESPS